MALLISHLLSFAISYSAPAPALPAWAQTQWTQAGLGTSFSRARYTKPGFLQADFNGDGKKDVALLVARTATKSQGIVILHQGTAQYYVLGAGSESSRGILGGDFEWVAAWGLYTDSRAFEVTSSANGDIDAEGGRTVRLKHPAIEILSEESGGGLIHWNGKRYVWIHQTC